MDVVLIALGEAVVDVPAVAAGVGQLGEELAGCALRVDGEGRRGVWELGDETGGEPGGAFVLLLANVGGVGGGGGGVEDFLKVLGGDTGAGLGDGGIHSIGGLGSEKREAPPARWQAGLGVCADWKLVTGGGAWP